MVSIIEPLCAPLDGGLKVALNVALLPAAIVVDVLRPFWLKPLPVTLI